MKGSMNIIVYLSILILIVSQNPITAETLFSEDFSEGDDKWEVGVGTWEVENGEFVQTDASQFTSCFLRSEFWDIEWTEYTLEVRAKKLGGIEGFCIVFGITQDNAPASSGARENFFDCNIGGWSNSRSGTRKWEAGAWTELDTSTHTVTNEEWYNIKIEVSPNGYHCYLNDEKMMETSEGPSEGRIGFILFSTSAVFDDVIVYDAGGPGSQVDPNKKLAVCWASVKF
jgi:alpha-L-arabinofuranosidase